MRRVALAYTAALDGLPDSLTSLSLCIKLNAIYQNWMEWKQKWYALPVPRLTGGPHRPRTEARPRELFERHPIALRRTPDKSSEDDAPSEVEGDRFFAGGPSQLFSTLLSSLRDARDNPASALSHNPETAGRRLFVILAARGGGKGHFFEAMRAEKRLDEFIEASWPRNTAPSYETVIMLNLSLSLEVTSIFDRIANVLVLRAGQVFNDAYASEIQKASKDLKRDRIGRLARILELYAAAPPKGRVMIAINNFSILFNRGGLPKNGQAARLLEALLGARSEKAPIDLLLACGESGFPSIFRKPDSAGKAQSFCDIRPFRLEHLVRPNIGDEGRRLLAVMIEKHRIAVESGPMVFGPVQRTPTPRGDPSAFFHVLHIARASLTIGTYFPLVSLALAAFPGKLSNHSSTEDRPFFLPGFRKRRAIQEVIVESLANVASDEDMTFVIPDATVTIVAKLKERGRSKFHDNEFENLIKDVYGDAIFRYNETKRNFILKYGSVRVSLREDAAKLDGDFKYLFHLFDHNRFMLTLACAAASEAGSMKGDEGKFRPADVIRWFRDLARTILGAPIHARPEITMDYVLRFYGSRHDVRMDLPVHCGIINTLERNSEILTGGKVNKIIDWISGPYGWQLQQALLWHLAVCGHPVEADVLASAPKIVEMLKMYGIEQIRSGLPVISVIEATLDLLVHRCLVFRLWGAYVGSPDAIIHQEADKGKSSEELSKKAERKWRFTLHRLMQSSIYLRLHAPAVEFQSVDQYSLSLYGVLPNDLPRPRAEAIQDLDALISAWTGFPRDVKAIDRGGAYHKAVFNQSAADEENFTDLTLPSRLLRAAYGVIRSVYSVSVVSRFDDFSDPSGPPIPVAGYFEQHRLQIQWLIQKAVDLSYAEPRPKVFSGEKSVDDSDVTPFYAEEIVWLYNECGLLSLIEGRLNDADHQFDSAFAAARRFEIDSDRSPLKTRITLNSSIVDIEKGRVGAARRRLGLIERQNNEHPAIQAVAGGYLGVCAHVNGDLVTAKNRYDEAIERLRKGHQSRGVAIFSRHLADLLRVSGPIWTDAAYTAVQQSITHAQSSGHEDIRQNARLARVRIDISRLPSTLNAGRIQTELDDVERYGQVMGMPRLACEVAYARATFLLAIGETQHATTLARRSLQIATQYDLKLRQVSALALLARIYEKRGLTSPAAALSRLAEIFANLCEYRNAHFAVTGRSDPQMSSSF